MESCYSLPSTSDDENPPWPSSPRNPRHMRAVSTARRRLSQIAEAARPSGAPAVRRRTAARALLNVRLRERDGPDVGRAASAGREGNFSSLQTLESKRNRIGIPPNPPPFRRTPMRRRRLSGRTARSRNASRSGSAAAGAKSQRQRAPALSRPGQSVASSRSRTLAASSSKENGFPIRCTPASGRPWWTIALRV
jgi:hypothetical protein